MRKLIALLLVLMMIPAAVVADGVLTLSVSSAVEHDTPFGRCVVPEGFTVVSTVVSCTTGQSVQYPCQAVITAGKENGPQMAYLSANDYIAGTGPEAVQQDGQFNLDFQTPMLHYMTAGEYCDYLAPAAFAHVADGGSVTEVGTRELPEIEAHYYRLMSPEIAKWKRELEGTIANVDDVKTSMCMKGYQFSVSGVTYYGIILTGNVGVWMSARGLRGTVSWVNWVVPFTYMMYASETDTEALDAFEMFVTNTSASDQFNRTNLEMSEELWKIIKKAHDITDCYSYSTQKMKEETAKGNDYDDERVTDYIFDQNDYTLEDGSHVKVSTGYSYVWEGDNGNVYASNSLFDQPGGSTQLYPNP